MFSVPLSVGSPRLGVTKHPALWSSDFPRIAEATRDRPAYSVVVYRMMRTLLIIGLAVIVVGSAVAASEPEVLMSMLDEPSDIVLDRDRVYWTTRGDGYLRWLAKDGGSSGTLSGPHERIGRLVLDATHVYWTAGPFIMKMPKAGGEAKVVIESEVKGGRGLSGIAVDGLRVYWTLYFDIDGMVMAADKNGGTPETLATRQDGALMLALDQDSIYWTNHAGVGKPVMRYGFDDRSVRAIAEHQYNPTWIALDDTFVYWTNLRGVHGAVMRANKADGSVEVFADEQHGPSVVALDDTFVYWTDLTLGPGNVATTSSIKRRPKSGGDEETLVEVDGHIWGLAIGDRDIYWTNYSEGRLCRMAK